MSSGNISGVDPHVFCLIQRFEHLNSEISFDDDEDEDGPSQRAWEGLIPKRILIYCL